MFLQCVNPVHPFILAADDVHLGVAWAALCQGVAIICHHAQEAVDLVIPVVLNRGNRTIKEEISAVFVRCKLQNWCPPAALDTDADTVRLFEFGSLPYIAVIMDLREDKGEVEYPVPVGSLRETPGTLSGVHPQCTIAIRGFSSYIYAPIDPAEGAPYRELLGNNMPGREKPALMPSIG